MIQLVLSCVRFILVFVSWHVKCACRRGLRVCFNLIHQNNRRAEGREEKKRRRGKKKEKKKKKKKSRRKIW